ncbi:unnamed protein product [Rotaria socialis]|uniref:Lactate/malate dehydrogenase N-terminal domain-containing protein n=1 Tax=Rotaria socialis TaxID=392032 RepID=A0A820PKR8_9BILA|nr:unnamed protein product [Rotaria socialis]CAF3330704.1 unnamed protein product [Rotaria socialis]CAF3491474.1 unnamed protein product [Rotaria socialis]CAF4406386.1 unnamed protein product [Rotaria socialis]CAF4409227.1 unnamed protein product [Rotaria socialis]
MNDTQYRTKLHPSSCFPPNSSVPNTQNRLFIRVAPVGTRQYCCRLTFVGINSTTYSTVAALLVYGHSTSIERITLFDIFEKQETRTILNDLQLLAIFNRTNIRLEIVQSYLETKDSSIIIINVQHYQLENESLAAWMQNNASLIQNIVSQVCIHSPHATLLICTQPNELMTYVASRVSKFRAERIIGLGASITTAYVHRTILNNIEKVHGHVNGFFVIGSGSIDDSVAKLVMNSVTVDGIPCSDIHSKLKGNHITNTTNENPVILKKENNKDWSIEKLLENKENVYSNVRRRLPIVTDMISRQKIAMKYLLYDSPISHSKSKLQESLNISFSTKLRSNWTEAMTIVRIIRALINGKEFQSNLIVNIAPIYSSTDVFINYPTIIGSSNRSIEYMLPFHLAQSILKEKLFLIPYEKLQRKLRV